LAIAPIGNKRTNGRGEGQEEDTRTPTKEVRGKKKKIVSNRSEVKYE